MKRKNLIVLLMIAITAVFLSGCKLIKPYEKPKFVEIEPNQTAFVIPLEGATSDQGQFESVEFLEENQVATKRVEIPRKWVKQGRLPGNGKYIDQVRVIVVDRYPETREWSGDMAYVGESKDSIKFDQGLSATAQILEEDTATFLYQYAGKTLEEVMDKEIRNYIGSILLEKYSTMRIEEIRADKKEVINYVRKQAEPYFKERGITLSNIGYIGDLVYHDKDIQKAINKKFNAEEEQKARETINKTNIADAKAEAEANRIRKESMDEILEIKNIELAEEWIKKWDGVLPKVQSGDDGGLIFSVPADSLTEETKKKE